MLGLYGHGGRTERTRRPKTNVAAHGEAARHPPRPEWADQIKQPVDWFKWGADLRLRQEYHENAITLNNDVPDHEMDYTRFAPASGARCCPRMTLRSTTAGSGKAATGSARDPRRLADSYIICDQLNVQMKNLFDTKSTLTVGRQDIIMNDGWLVLEGTPLDGSRTIFFDAVRLQGSCRINHSSLDLAVLQTHQDAEQLVPDDRQHCGVPERS